MTKPLLHPAGLPTAADLAGAALWARLAAVLGDTGERARTRRDAAFAFIVRVVSAALLYLSQIVLARWLGTFEYGIYVFVWTWVLVLGGLSHLGLSTVAMRLVPEYSVTGDKARLRGLLLCSRLTALVVGTLVAGLGIAGLALLGDHLAPHYLLPAALALVCLPLYALTDIQDGIGRGRGWIGIALIPPYVLRPILVLSGMAVAHACALPMSATTAAAAAIIATWATAIIQTIMLQARLGPDIARGPRAYEFRRWFATAAPLLAFYAAELVLQNADVLMVSAYLTPVEVGMYFAASKTMSLVMFVHYAVGSAVAKKFSALNARDDRAGLEVFVWDAVRWTFWPSLATAVVILGLGWPLLRLFSPQFTAAYPLMFVLVIGFLVRAAVGPAEFLLNMLGEQKLCAAVLVAAAVLDVGLNIVLVPRFGLIGAAASTAAAMSAAAILNAIVANRRLGLTVVIGSRVLATGAARGD